MTTVAKGVYLGQPVVFAKELRRVCTGTHVVWVEQDCKLQRGVVVGVRSVQEGYTAQSWNYEESAGYFVQTGRVAVILVATDIYMLPTYVPVGAAVPQDVINEPLDEVGKVGVTVCN